MCVGGRKVIRNEMEDGELSPQLVAAGNGLYKGVIEELELLQVTEKMDAILAWVLSHSVSNAKYGRKDRVLGMYLQNLVLKMDDGTKVPTRAVKVYTRLCA